MTSDLKRMAIAYRIARTPGDLSRAFQLVYESYVSAGLGVPNEFGMRLIDQHLLDTTEVFLAEQEPRNQLAATISLVGDGALGLPMESVFRDEVSRYRDRGRTIAEVSCLAERQDLGSSFSVVTRIMAVMAQCARYRGVQDLLITVHPRHAGFYERFIAFQTIGRERTYARVCDQPAIAMGLNLSRLQEDHPRVYDRFFGRPFPPEELEASQKDLLSIEYQRHWAIWNEVLRVQRNRDRQAVIAPRRAA